MCETLSSNNCDPISYWYSKWSNMKYRQKSEEDSRNSERIKSGRFLHHSGLKVIFVLSCAVCVLQSLCCKTLHAAPVCWQTVLRWKTSLPWLWLHFEIKIYKQQCGICINTKYLKVSCYELKPSVARHVLNDSSSCIFW